LHKHAEINIQKNTENENPIKRENEKTHKKENEKKAKPMAFFFFLFL